MKSKDMLKDGFTLKIVVKENKISILYADKTQFKPFMLKFCFSSIYEI